MTAPPNRATRLVLSSMGVPIYSARGLTQTLEPIDPAGYLRRTINGALMDLSVPELRKYRSVITGSDVDPPAFDKVWPGMTVTVNCIAELGYLTSGGSAGRTPVSGSQRVVGDFTYYRPQLSMLVVRVPVSSEEWTATNGWSLELEEV